MKKLLTTVFILLCIGQQAFAVDTYMSPEVFRSYGKQQIRTKDSKGNRILVTPNYQSYKERNEQVSEKVVAIYDKRSPAYGYRYIIYTPIKGYVGHRRILQPSPNGYGFDPIPEGDTTGISSKVPCFKTIEQAKRYYYPNLYKDKTPITPDYI